jgi:uncharacterized protein (DUF58 family)
MPHWLKFGGTGATREDSRGAPAPDRGQGPPSDPFDEEFQKKLEYLAIVSRRVFPGRTRGERRSKKTGTGIEFADYRQYSPGDDSRYLDWNVLGRLDRLLIRLFEEEEDLTVYLLVDSSGSMGFGSPPKLDYAKRLAAAIAFIALSHLDRVAVIAFRDTTMSRTTPARGKHHIFNVFDLLRSLVAEGQTDLQGTMRSFAAQNRRRGVVVLVSDLFDPAGFETAINTLRYSRYEPYVIQLVDAGDRFPDLHGDLLLEDGEDGRQLEITVTPRLLGRYASAYARYTGSISEFCSRTQIPLFPLDTAVPFEDAVLRLLRHGGMVG